MSSTNDPVEGTGDSGSPTAPDVPPPDPPRTRSQTRSVGNAVAASVTVTIGYESLAIAMSRINEDSASNLEKGTQPKRNFKIETFVDWEHKVEVYRVARVSGTC